MKRLGQPERRESSPTVMLAYGLVGALLVYGSAMLAILYLLAH